MERPVVLSRDAESARGRLAGGGGAIEAHSWEPQSGPPPEVALRGADAVVNLAGEPVADGRWTEERKRRIRDSRVIGTRNLVAGLRALAQPPAVLVSASAVGYYGDRGDETLDEQSSPGGGFLAESCAAWEHEAMAAASFGIRVVCVRIGVVLAVGGGALAKMLGPFRVGVGGKLGSGQQWMPWIHIDDVAGLFTHALRNHNVTGPMNAAAPRPVTNADFTRALGKALHRPAILPIPAVALRVLFGEMHEILTGSQRVLPRVAEQSGYAFKHPDVSEALAAVTAT